MSKENQKEGWERKVRNFKCPGPNHFYCAKDHATSFKNEVDGDMIQKDRGTCHQLFDRPVPDNCGCWFQVSYITESSS